MLSNSLTVDHTQPPFAATRRRIDACVRGVKALLRFGFALLAGVTLYGAVTGLFTCLCTPYCMQAPFVYAMGIILGGTTCILATTLALPRSTAMVALPFITAMTILLPIGLFCQFAAASGWYPIYMTYLTAAVAGGICGANLTLGLMLGQPDAEAEPIEVPA